MQFPILPPSPIGILGSGQLGRMLALVARRMGYRVHVFGPGPDSPAGQVADRSWTEPYADVDAVRDFARSVAVVTYEFENIPLATAAAAAELTPVLPGLNALGTAQNRLREKGFLAENDIPIAPYIAVRDAKDFSGTGPPFPGILKTAESGYDGKGQKYVENADQALQAWEALGRLPAVLEEALDLKKEISVIIGRDQFGGVATYGPIENRHVNHILDVSLCPASVSAQVARGAVEIARKIAADLDLVGVICIEFFITGSDRLLVNEIAPRPHNSGHLTIEAHITSQFEQQLRTICGLAIGDPGLRQPAAMANLLGEIWPDQSQSPRWERLTPEGRIKLHLYGKNTARPGRKMGHITACASAVDEAITLVSRARERIRPPIQKGETPV